MGSTKILYYSKISTGGERPKESMGKKGFVTDCNNRKYYLKNCKTDDKRQTCGQKEN